MLPAPARIASTPRQNSRTSWNPAVPPPPAPGGAVGNELADGLGGGDGLGLGAVALGAVMPGAVVPGALVPGAVVPGALVPGALLEVVTVGLPLAEMAGVAGRVPPGENEGGVVDGEPDVHADTDAVASTAQAAQPRTVPRKRRRP